MTDKKRVVVIGGGYGGVEAAKKIAHTFRRDESVQVTLIDRNPYHTLMTELHEIAGSRTEPEAVQVSFAKVFGSRPVDVAIDEVEAIDFGNRQVHSKSHVYGYDYLIVGAGGAPEFFDVPGVQENSFTLWSLEDALRIRTHVEECFREAAKEPDSTRRRTLLTFAIAGAGFTGVELAGELLERKRVLCPKYHIDEREVRVLIIEAKDTILPIFPRKPGEKARQHLERLGCEILVNTAITGAEPGKILLGGNSVEAETFIWTAGIHGGELSARMPLTQGHTARGECSVASPEGIHGMAGCHFDEDERYVVGQRGRVLVNEFMQSVDYENVYLIGDIMWYVEKEHVLPQVVETALQTAETAAHNIIADIKNGKKKAFTSNYHGFMVSVGSRYGVAHVLGVSVTGFMALAIKHLINLHYLFGLAGFNACWQYVKEEFIDVKDRRSMVHGHLSGKISAFWALPLRLFMGVKWFVEGWKKIGEGWLNPGESGLRDVWTGAIRLPGVSFADATASATDAATAATDAVATATEAVAGATEAATSYGDPIMPALGIYTWFAETVLSSSTLLAFLLQSGVVIAEMVIGLALIGGFLTVPAALVSIGLCLMFIISGWGSVELLWYLFAAFVLVGGAGRSFGLDHYSTPILGRWWSGRSIAKRSYLYTGEPRS